MDWIALVKTIKTWTVSFCVFSICFVSLNLLRRSILQKFDPSLSSQSGPFKKEPVIQINELLIQLLKRTRLSFLFFWAVFAGMLFHNTPDYVVEFARKFIFFISMVQIGTWLSSVITFWIDHTVKLKLAEDLASASTMGLMNSLAKFALYGLLVLIILNNFGIDISAFVAGLGVSGIAVALAVQNILGDLFASLTIVLDKPFIVGDLIVAGDFTGYVERIGLKTTHIRSISGEQLIFPNGDLLKSRIRNFKRMEERRILFLLHIEHTTPHKKLMNISSLLKNVIDHQVQARFERANLKSLGLISIDYEIVYWVTDRDMNVYTRVHESLCLEILRRLKKEEILLARFTPVVPFKDFDYSSVSESFSML